MFEVSLAIIENGFGDLFYLDFRRINAILWTLKRLLSEVNELIFDF